jgi:hypothetical protein
MVLARAEAGASSRSFIVQDLATAGKTGTAGKRGRVRFFAMHPSDRCYQGDRFPFPGPGLKKSRILLPRRRRRMLNKFDMEFSRPS